MKQIALVLFVLFLAGCNNENSADANNAADSASRGEDQIIDRSDINHSCCFQTEKDFLPFYPDSSADFRPDQGARDIEMKCITDTMLVSSSTKGYLDANDKLISIKISDYCAIGEQQLDTNYSGMLHAYKQDKAVNEYNEFEVPGEYYGFACYIPANRLAILTIVVDKRFTVEIVQHQASSSKSVLKMLEYVPVKELAVFGK